MGATLTSNQVTCAHCEEIVHRYAARCPYCQHDLCAVSLPLPPASPPQPQQQMVSNPAPSKITHLSQPQFSRADEPVKTKPDALLEVEESHDSSLTRALFPLIALLAGSFFVFFGLMLKFFAKNGKLTLEWSADAWPYYLFPAIFLLIIGMMSLSPPEHETIT